MSGRSSPRPGVATCKFKPKKQRVMGYNSNFNLNINNRNMLNGRFIRRTVRIPKTSSTIQEKRNEKVQKKPLIENITENIENAVEENNFIKEVSTKKSSELAINTMIKKNNLIKQQILATQNPVMKQLLKHEIRLNIQDINIECLNDINSTDVLKKQETESFSKVLDELSIELNIIKEKQQLMEVKQKETTNSYQRFYGDYKFKIDEFQDKGFQTTDSLNQLNEFKNNTENTLNENSSKINYLTEKNQELIELNDSLKVKLRCMKENLFRLCEKLCNDNNSIDAWDIKNDLETLDI